MTLKSFQKFSDSLPLSEKMPVLFVGHGSPMNAVENNQYSQAWKKLGRRLPRARAILSISAHWLTQGTYVHVAPKPKTIHDFYGFPPELYQLRYPCPGSPEFAEQVRRGVRKTEVRPDAEWGIDHGTWVVARHIFSDADIPLFQMSIDFSRNGRFHYDLGRELKKMRRRGLLIMASGNIVHHLGFIKYERDAEPFEWAAEFDLQSKTLIEKGDHAALVNYQKLGEAANISIPTPDHYFPLLYALGLQDKGEGLEFPVDGIAHGSVGMRGVLIGAAN